MILKIQREILSTDNLSGDKIFELLESYLSNRFKFIRNSDSLYSFKRLYKFKANGREMIYKQLSINDSGQIKIKNKSIVFIIDLTKQMVTTILAVILLLPMLWLAFNIKIIISISVILILVIIIWITILDVVRTFLDVIVQDLECFL